MAPSRTTAAKKHRLTFAQLSAYDDILTDALVDHVSASPRGGGAGEPFALLARF